MLLTTSNTASQNSINPRVGLNYRHVKRNVLMLFLPGAQIQLIHHNPLLRERTMSNMVTVVQDQAIRQSYKVATQLRSSYKMCILFLKHFIKIIKVM